jgi:subtilase family serine protease
MTQALAREADSTTADSRAWPPHRCAHRRPRSWKHRLLAPMVMAWLVLVSWGAVSVRAAQHDLHRPPLAFEANRGQVDQQVKFLARGVGYTAYLTTTGAQFTLGNGRPARAIVRFDVIGGNAAPQIVPEGELPGVVNYSRGARAGAPISTPTYSKVRYVDVYPGVDLVYYGNRRRLEYDFVVAAGADPSRIALSFDGAERLELSMGGDLVLRTAAGELRQPPPVVYQEIDGERRLVVGEYVLADEGHVRIRLGEYDTSRPLVIDPILTYSTYLGGNDDEADGLYGGVAGIAVDAAGNAYVTGTTRSLDFPTTPGADRARGGNEDAFVTKLSPTGAVLYSTYVGGPCEDVARSIAVDAAGNAYITGRAHGGWCPEDVQAGVLVAKLGPTGAVLYTFMFGGSLADTSIGQAIAIDAQGHAYVAGLAQGSTGDFPTTPGAYRTIACTGEPIATGADGFVAKINPAGTALVYSTLVCGDAHDSPNSIAIDAARNVYIAGSTDSHDFPVVNALQPTHRGGPAGTTGFVAKLSADGSQLVYSTYLGGWVQDIVQGIAVDAAGNAFVTGATKSDDFPTTAGVLQPVPGNHACGWDFCWHAFVAKINATGSEFVYSTFLYGEAHDLGARIAVDAVSNAYVVGKTSSVYFPIADAFQSTTRGLDDVFITKLTPDGARIVYSSYLGGRQLTPTTLEGVDQGTAIAIDAAGNAYIAGYTASPDFPTTPGAFQTAPGGGVCDIYGSPCGDVFVAKITAGGPGVVPPISLVVTPWELAPGGTFTATWAGLPAPGPIDELRLYPLGWPGDDFTIIASWPTTGAATGTLVLTLPTAIAPGTYELRVLSADPNVGGFLEHMTRSRPMRIGVPAPDLIVANIASTPAQPAVGQPVAVTVTVTNQGAAPAGAFAIDFYKSRVAAPAPGIAGDVRCAVAALAAGASAQCAGTVTYAAAGTANAWAQVDTGQAVLEANDDNNVAGPKPVVIGAAAQADLLVVAVGNPPAAAPPGGSFAASDTVRNQGASAAAASKTRHYLSIDIENDAADTLLTGLRSVPTLAPGAQSAGTVTVTIPTTTPPGTYRLIACADDTVLVGEANETNNCSASAATVVVGRPDLVETAVTNPPAAIRAGMSFTVTDTVRNQGVLTASGSTTRYYFSTDAEKSADDKLLTGTRGVPALAAGAVSTQTAPVTTPTTMPPGIYFLLACADDTKVVTEGDEGNNCRASAATVTVALADLAQQTVSNPTGPFRRGTAFTVSDTVRNDAPVGTPRSTTTRYYLSADAVRGLGDTLLSGVRTIPVLAPGAASTGAVSVVIPSTTVPGTYVVLACADGTALVAEASEINNCRASGTTVVVNP